MANVILQEDQGRTLSQLVDQGSVAAVMEFFEKYEVRLIHIFSIHARFKV